MKYPIEASKEESMNQFMERLNKNFHRFLYLLNKKDSSNYEEMLKIMRSNNEQIMIMRKRYETNV